MESFKILGLESFDAVERERIVGLSSGYYEKIKRNVSGLMVLHGKKHDLEGKQSKFSFHVRIEGMGPIIEARDDDWDLARALHKTLKKLENAIQKKYKTKGKRV